MVVNGINGILSEPLREMNLDKARQVLAEAAESLKKGAQFLYDKQTLAALFVLDESAPGEFQDVLKIIKKAGAVDLRDWREHFKNYQLEAKTVILPAIRRAIAPQPKDLTTAEIEHQIEAVYEPRPTEPIEESVWDPRPSFDGKGDQDLVPLAAEVWKSLAEAEKDIPTLFWSNGVLSRLELAKDEEGGDELRISPMTPDLFFHRLSHLGRWRKFNEFRGYYDGSPPATLIRYMLATPKSETPIPTLKRVVTTPVFTKTGKLLTSPGYDRQSGLYLIPSFQMRPLPSKIEPGHLEEAHKLIGELLCDFPFADESDKDNAIALMILPFVREMIPGFTPIHMVKACLPRSGKGLLLDCILGISSRVATMTYTHDDEPEIRKQITTHLANHDDVVLIDNINDLFASGQICAAVTCNDTWNARLLGTNQSCNVKPRTIWAATANNPRMSSEIAGRTVTISLTPDTDKPELRQAFHHPLPNWAIENRPALVWAVQVCVLNWLEAGRPAATVNRVMGRFEDWVDVLGGIMDTNGYSRFLGNTESAREDADIERSPRAMFFHEWFRLHPDPYCTNGDEAASMVPSVLYEKVAQNIADLPIKGESKKSLETSFGNYLHSCLGINAEYHGDAVPRPEPQGKEKPPEPAQIFESFVLFKDGKRTNKGQKWGLRRIKVGDILADGRIVMRKSETDPRRCKSCGTEYSGQCGVCAEPPAF